MGYLIGAIIGGIIWGFATNAVIENKGYSENWFWWGFFFGFIAFIVACTKPECRRDQSYESTYSYSDTMNFLQGKQSEASRQSNGSWQCRKCNAWNPSYTGTCSCGRSKSENDELARKIKEREDAEKKAKELATQQAQAKIMTESEKADALLKYKGLLDAGVLTEEEFNKKKAELLSDNTVPSNDAVGINNGSSTPIMETEYSSAEKTVLNILAKYPNGASAMTISQIIPRRVAPKEISDGLKHLVEMGAITKDTNGNYIIK